MLRLESARAPGFLKYLRPELETAIKMAAAVALASLVVLSFAWGYEQRQQARVWRKVACVYRLQESVRRAPFTANVLNTPDACATLEDLGLTLDVPSRSPVSDVSAGPRASRVRQGS